MTDPISGIAIITAAGITALREPINNLLGPVSTHYGNSLLEFAKEPSNSWLVSNVSQVTQIAIRKLGDKINSPGSIPPRVAKTVIEESMISDDVISLEYFGGVLASSRTELGRDDRGARIAKKISEMSVYHLRTHYLIYSTIIDVFSSSNLSFRIRSECDKMGIFIPLDNYIALMEFSNDEFSYSNSIVSNTLTGLIDDDHIASIYGMGTPEELRKHFPRVEIPNTRGLICTPTITGAELFLWAFGYGNQRTDFLFDKEFVKQIDGIPDKIPNCIPLDHIP